MAGQLRWVSRLRVIGANFPRCFAGFRLECGLEGFALLVGPAEGQGADVVRPRCGSNGKNVLSAELKLRADGRMSWQLTQEPATR